jgi:hypothetical protein
MAASIFISYAREDRARAELLANRFASVGWSVWWDRQIVGGSHFDKATEDAIAAAKVVVVLWSRASVTSYWVRAEAGWALDRDKLLPVKIDDIDQPLQFFHVQAINLAGSNLTKETPALTQLLAELAQRLGDAGLRTGFLRSGIGHSRGSDVRTPRVIDPPRGGPKGLPRSGDRGSDPPSEVMTVGAFRARSGQLPLALLGAVLATLIIAASYIVLSDRSAPIVPQHEVSRSVVHVDPAPAPSSIPPRPSAPAQDKYLPTIFPRQ